MTESLQHWLDRNRPPRVQITYDVETGGAIEKKELPFIVGILADLSGNAADEKPKLKDRKFVEIDRDNFNDVMASIAPRVKVSLPQALKDKVPDELKADGKLETVSLTSMDDFDPLQIVKNVPYLERLYQTRRQLTDLLTKLDGNDKLETLLVGVMTETAQQQALTDAIAQARPADADTGTTDTGTTDADTGGAG